MARSEEFDNLLREAGAEYGEWLGVPVVQSFGDIDAEYRAVTEGLAIADRSSRGTVVALGSEVVPLLQGVVTSDVFLLAEPGSGQRSTAVNSTGRMMCDLRLLHGPDILVMDFEPGLVESGIISHFRANVMTEDARFVDRTSATSRVAVFGLRAADALSEVASLARPLEELDAYGGTWGSIAGHDVVVQRIESVGEPGYDLLLEVDAAVDVWSLIAERGAVPVGDSALDVLRLEAGIPRWGAELDAKVIPLEASLEDAISFHKGCYVGQEIIARLDSRGVPAKLLRALVLEGDEVPDADEEIFDGEKKIGTVRVATFSPRLGAPLATAYLKRDYNEPGRSVRVGDTAAVVCALGEAPG